MDFRLYPRVFKEAPSELIDDDTIKIVNHFSSIIFDKEKNANEIIAIIHYTIVEAIKSSCPSNSPEGIHQDGMDYIISALVMERVNITGGISNIYYPNYENKLIEIELKEGFGIFQPDINVAIFMIILACNITYYLFHDIL